jgi:acetate kinase
MTNVLVLNSGSSSLKFQIIATDADAIEHDTDERRAWGTIERIGSEALLSFGAQNHPPHKSAAPLRDHRAALDAILHWLVAAESGPPVLHSPAEIEAVGHRVVHGGEKLSRSVLLDEDSMRDIEACIELAPLHNPANLRGIRAARAVFGDGVPQVAVFDTSFHSTMPETSFLYAIPYSHYVRHKVRRYGFHGTSHRYVAYRYRKLTGKSREDTKIITLHLGNGCSACAIVGGKSFDTSMGLTPLEGLVMGTRSGDVDASVLEFLHHKEGFDMDELVLLLNKQSGLLGVSGLTNDMRDLLAEEKEHQDRRAKLAIDLFCLRVKKYIGAYLARMNGADAIVFTGGIGENSPEIRSRVCADLDALGIALDPAKNAAAKAGSEGDVAAANSRVRVFVVPTNEELLIARDTVRVVMNLERRY